jgi:UDP-N-acetylmuramoyl-tripeptide--D-alanyl-D-alanine ligase
MIENLHYLFSKCGAVSTDTRAIVPGSIFFALKGPKFNANAFAEEALAKGAAYAVIDDTNFKKDERYILVEDTLKTLQKLARYHRDKLDIPVIGLTGSNGKTTSKELLNAVLSKRYKTYATKGNLNNHIGVPLTLLSIDYTIEIAIIEMGANHVGDIEELCSYCDPTIGFITNIGKAHIGEFGGFQNIIKGKTEIYKHLLDNFGAVFINSQNPILAPFAADFDHPYFYPGPQDFYHCEFIDANPFVRVRAENGEVLTTRLTGAYNFENIAVALCLGLFFGVDPTMANEAVQTYEPSNMRSQIINKGSNTIILDAYNANPTSMEAAIINLSKINANRKVAILGDMFELGDDAAAEHKRIGELLKELNINEAYVVGGLMKSAREVNAAIKHVETKQELIELLAKQPISGATILVKASRGIGLETIVDSL